MVDRSSYLLHKRSAPLHVGPLRARISPKRGRTASLPLPLTPKEQLDVIFWLMNVSSSVCIILINKQLLGTQGHGFTFATSLCAIHYFVTTAWTWVQSRYLAPAQGSGKGKASGGGTIGWRDLAIFTVVADLSIISLNTSLQVNPVPFYQIAKLGIIPCTCAVESLWLGKVLSREMGAALVVVMTGVAIVTVTELSLATSAFGALIALSSTVCSAMQQILCGYYQRKNAMTGSELLRRVAPLQGISMAVVAPFIDLSFTGKWLFSYGWTGPAMFCLMGSCFFAVMVNVSQFLCLGRFSAVSYQVVGHAKTILVLLLGWGFFGGIISKAQALGIALAVGGMVWYGRSSRRANEAAKVLPTTRHANGAGKV